MTANKAPQPRRPILVWVIFLFYLVSSVQVIVSMFFIAAGGVDMTPEMQAALAQFTVFDRVIGYANAAVTLVGVTMLLGLRRQAVSVLALAFALNLFATAVAWYKVNPLETVATKGLVAQICGITLFGAVVFYAWRLGKRGVLQDRGSSRPVRPRT
ncbi:MAG: hypothetical protein AB7U59_10015 [Desulfovibrionaceae bacterium]|jgi:hypothetical protein